MIAGIVLAAGAGTRFGGLKQLAEIDGVPMLGHVLAAAPEGGLGRVVVVLGADSESVAAGVDLHGAGVVVCRSWAQGQSASLACGLAAVADAEAAVVLLGDQPRVSPEAIRRVLAARGGTAAVRATYDGRPGHPVVLEHSLFGRVRDVTGDAGARNLLLSAGVRPVECGDLGGGGDVDTPAELEALRESAPAGEEREASR